MHRTFVCPALALLSLALASCGVTPAPVPSSEEGLPVSLESAARVAITRVEVTPSSALLTSVGASVTLHAAAYDASGRKVSAAVKWVSSNPAAVSVDARGKATAKVAVGSSQITAEVNGVRSKPAFISVVRLNPNAVVVTDAQIASGAVPLVPGPNGSPIGAQFKVTLNGVNPKPGQVLLSSGTSPINGRVLSSAPSGKQAVVTLETVPLSSVYQDLNVSQRVQLTSADVVPLTGAAAPAQAERHPDGSLSVSYRLPGNLTRGRAVQPQSLPSDPTVPGPYLEKEFSVGPFKCKTTLDTLIAGDLLTLKIEDKLDVDLSATVTNGDVQAFSALVSGEISGTVTGGLDVDLGAQGELKCRAILAHVPVPVTGPLASFIAPTIPIGVGFGLDGKLKIGKVQFALEGKIGTKRKLGFTYDGLTGTVTPVNEGETTTTLIPKVKLPNPLPDFRFEGGLGVQAVTGLDLTAVPWLGQAAPAFKALEVTFGPRLEGSFAPELTQAEVNDYSSSYALKLVGGLGPGDSLQDLAGVLGSRNQWKLFNFAASKEIALSRSPNGTITGPGTAKVGQPATLAVDLNPANVNFLPGVYAPSEVRMYRVRGLTLEYAGVVTPTPGQTHFEFPWTPTAADAGQTVVFRAFVSSGLFGVAALELDDDAKLAVAVSADDSGTAPPPAPPAPPAPVALAWYGTITRAWTHNAQQTSSDGSQFTKRETGKHTCTYGAVNSSGQQTFDWTYTVDHWSKTLYADGKHWIYTAKGDRLGNTARPAGTLDIRYLPEEYVTGIKEYYWSEGNRIELGNWWLPMETARFCALGAVVDEDASPDAIRGRYVYDSPEGQSVTTVNLTRR